MALRKILIMNDTEGFYEEAADADSWKMGGLTMSGTIAMGTNKITGAGSATSNGDVLVYGQSGGALGNLTISSGGDIVLSGGGEVTGLPATPGDSTAATSKAYVDSVAQGLDVHPSVKAMSSANVTSLSGPQTIDGVSLIADNRVLLVGQTTASQNGIWIVKAGAWVRATDLAVGASAAGSFVFVEEGTSYADTGWVCTANVGTDVVGTDSLPFSQFSGAGTYTAGDGLVLNGGQFSVDLTATPGLEFSSGNLQAKVNPAGAIERVSAGLGIILEASDPSLQISSNELGAKLDGARAITKGASGIGLNLETSNPAIKIATNKLDVKYQTAKGLTSDGSGLYVKIDGSTITFDGGGNLQAATSPEAEKIENSVAVDEAVAAGDPVYFTATGNRVGKADTTDAKAKALGIARTAQAVVGQITEIVTSGIAVGVLSSASPGTPYYLATGGGLSTSLPGAAKRVIQMGIAKNATDLFVRVVDYGKKAA